MQLSNIAFMAKAVVELSRVECDFIEYKRSASQRDSILKTACAYANNYMNREIGLIIIGVEELDEPSGEKAVPRRPALGIDEAKLESTENGLKSLLAEIHPRINYHLLDIEVDGRTCLVVAVEPGVYVYRDTLSFINHNRPLPPVTIEDMNTREEFRDRNYLNPEITSMFHALGLIESYGSGIRRAKHAMAENGNPPLYFEPTNDTDDYTMVTCPINEEFAHIRDHEDETTKKVSEDVSPGAQQTVTNTVTKLANTVSNEVTGVTNTVTKDNAELILEMLAANPRMSTASIAEHLAISKRGVRYHLDKLSSEGRIKHVGPTRGGYWQIGAFNDD